MDETTKALEDLIEAQRDLCTQYEAEIELLNKWLETKDEHISLLEQRITVLEKILEAYGIDE
jgi:bacterioferritin (cytochrome b1)